MFVDEVIQNDFKSWRGRDTIFIESQTGSGKTTFILETLLPYVKSKGKEILYLSNRTLLNEQIKAKIAEKQGLQIDNLEWLEGVKQFDGITVLSYQSLQDMCNRENIFQYNGCRYMYVIFDEVHYLLEDSAFNPNVYHLINFIKYIASTAIFLSATMGDVKAIVEKIRYGENILNYTWRRENNYLSICNVNSYVAMSSHVFTKIWSYKIPNEKRNIKCIYFDEYKEIVELINNANKNEKWLFFVSSKDKAEKIISTLNNKKKILISSANKKNEIVRDIIQNGQFSCDVLLTTKVLDNGVSIKDKNLKFIVIDTVSQTEFVQMLGRKRFVDEEDNVVLFIPKKNAKIFAGYLYMNLSHINEFLDKRFNTNQIINELMNETEVSNHIRRFYCWKDGEFVLNPFATKYFSNCTKFLEDIIQKIKIDEFAFIKEQLSWIGLEDTFSENNWLALSSRKNTMCEIEVYLQSLVGIKLDEEKQQELKCWIGQIARDAGISIGSKKNAIAGKKLLNRFLDDNGIEYEIESTKTQKRGEKTKWMIKKRR